MKRVMRGEGILDLIHGKVELTRNYVKQVGGSRVVQEDDAIPSDFRPAADGPVLFPPSLRRRAVGVRGRAAARVIFVASEVAPPPLVARSSGRLLRRGGDRRRRSEEREAVGDVGTDGGTDGETDGGGCDVAHGDGTTSRTARKKSANILIPRM